MKINHNISAQLANVNLKKNNDRLSLSMQKLSSGYKITKAADDSAGLAISNKMRTQIRALDRSAQNAEDGVSIIESEHWQKFTVYYSVCVSFACRMQMIHIHWKTERHRRRR